MTQLRFATARDLFATFETAPDDIRVEPTDAPAMDFLNSLIAAPDLRSAVGFCAYLLPRRAAVWWACQSVRAFGGPIGEADEFNLDAAEGWVKEPEEERRWAALDRGMAGDKSRPSTWAALAAGWSGGSMVRNEHNAAPAPPHATPKAAIAAILICTATMRVEERDGHLLSCVQSAIRLAQASAK